MTALMEPLAPALGAQTPRVTHVPTYSSSAGAEAVDLAASAGLVLDPWQAHVLDGSLGENYDLARRRTLWSAFEVGLIVPRQNGKGSVLEARELAGLFLLGERLILHSAHEMKTCVEAYLRVKQLIQDTPELDRMVAHFYQSNEKTAIELKNGARLRFVPRSGGSGRGFSGDCIILDEAYNLPQRNLAALLPTLAARPNPQLWYTSSAGMDDSEVLAKVRQRALSGDAKRMAYFEWSAPDDADLDDRAAWAVANPGLGIRIQEDFIAAEREALGEDEFARERLGIWADSRRATVIDMALWAALADRQSTVLDPVAFAVDVSPDRKTASLALSGLTPTGRQHVEVIEAGRRGTDWIAERLAELNAKWKPCAVVLDPAGPAGSLIPDLDAAGIATVKLTGREMAQACGFFHDAAISGRLAHLGQPQLTVALDRARKRPLGDAWAWHRKDATTDITPLVAATLAAFGHSVHSRVAKKPAQLYGF
jgi:phage terminase large subunit-like protein